jgi:hypothetical protein
MNTLRPFAGKVPVHTKTGIALIDFPSRKDFESLYLGRAREESIGKFYSILKARAGGATLVDSGKTYGLTKERVRQIEAKFLRLIRERHTSSF